MVQRDKKKEATKGTTATKATKAVKSTRATSATKTTKSTRAKKIKTPARLSDYKHADKKRKNNPDAGAVTLASDPVLTKPKKYK